MSTSIGNYGLLAGQSGARFRNVYLMGAEDAPAYACLEIIGRAYNGGLVVRKPASSDMGGHRVLFASDQGIRAGGWGDATNTWPVLAVYGSSVDAANRERIGTMANDWSLRRGHEGFLTVDTIPGMLGDGKLVSVMPDVICRDPSHGGYYYGYSNPHTLDGCCQCDRFSTTDDYPTNFPATLTATITCSTIGSRTITLNREDFYNSIEVLGCYSDPDITGTIGAKAYYNGQYMYNPDPFNPFFEPIADCFTGVITNLHNHYELLNIRLLCQYDRCAQGDFGILSDYWHIVYSWTKTEPGDLHHVQGDMTPGVVCSPLFFTKTGTSVCYGSAPAYDPCPATETDSCTTDNAGDVGSTVQVDIAE